MSSKQPFFFISTNLVWGGSEELWFQSVRQLIAAGQEVSLALKYQTDNTRELFSQLSSFTDYRKQHLPPALYKRMINKIRNTYHSKDILRDALKTAKPELVVISQGNNTSSLDIMELCIELQLKYVVLTHLVTDMNWFSLTDELRNRFVRAYSFSTCNFFVSRNNIDLHQFLLAHNFGNNEVVYNPYRSPADFKSPSINSAFSFAVVGRTECYHKGLDLLLKVISSEKWQARDVRFNLYGSGPHKEIIASLLDQLNITNCFLHEHSDLNEIWTENQALLLPSRMEGNSLALVEAVLYNKPVVATNVGAASEMIIDNETGFIAAYANEDSIDEAMERSWIAREKWMEMGEKGGARLRSLLPAEPVKDFNSRLFHHLDN